MRAIIIGAGRGRRLMPTTADAPKCYAEVQGRRMLDWALEALAASGITDICFIGGYQIDKVRADYPHFTFRHNTDWENNNILASLMHAEDLMDEPFVCCYSDILFTREVVDETAGQPGRHRAGGGYALARPLPAPHATPADDAEKVTANNGLVTRIHRGIEPPQRTANTPASRSSRRAAPRRCASTISAAKSSMPASRSARRRCSRRRTSSCCSRK